MTTPIYDLTEWAAAQASPWVPHNLALRALEALVRASVSDRDLTAPPGSCADGAAFLIDDSATGAWEGHDGKMAVAVGVDAANGWIILTAAHKGYLLFVEDEDKRFEWSGSAWVEFTGGGGGGGASDFTDLDDAPSSYTGAGGKLVAVKGDMSGLEFVDAPEASPAAVATESGTTYDLAAGDEGKYIRFTNSSAKTVTVRDESDHALAGVGGGFGEWHLRNIGAGDLTLVEDTAVTINPPAGGTLVVPEGGTVTLKRVAEDEFDLMGVTVPL